MTMPIRRLAPSGAQPPWLWLWLVLYLVSLPDLVEGWRTQVAVVTGAETYYPELAGTTSLTVLRLFGIVQLLPSLALLLGVALIFLPWLRGWWVRRRFRLIVDHRQAVREMQDFVDSYAPGVLIRTNAVRSDRLARIYPTGWRSARIAVFGPLITLWRRDQEAAKTVLLHEIAHYRNGDQLIVGLGSPFVLMVNAWLPAFVVAGLVPLAVLFAQDYPTATPLTAQVVLLVTQVPRLLLLPVVGLWLAELAADRFVVDLGGGAALSRCVAGRTPGRTRWRLGVLGRLSHPPAALRRWACRATRPHRRDVVLLATWPLLGFGVLLIVLAGAVPAWLLLGYSWSETWTEALTNSRTFLISWIPEWVLALALITAWPALSRLWTWLCTRQPLAPPTSPVTTYATAAVIPAILLAGGLALTGPAVAGTPVAGTSRPVVPAAGEPTTPTTTTTTTTTTTEPTTSTTTETTESTTEEAPADEDTDLLSGSYDVTLTGYASGQSFQRSATLSFEPTIATTGSTNGVNPLDMCLISGFPGAQPEPGAAWLSSNSGCNPGASAADMDMGDITVDGSTVTFVPDERIAATMANNFTVSSGLAACIYAPVSGHMTVTVADDGTVTGTIAITGYGGAFCGNSTYEAEIS